MAHTLALGMGESGKTTLFQKLSHSYYSQGWDSIILDPFESKKWKGLVTADVDRFIRLVNSNRNVMIFIDEGATTVVDHKKEMKSIATLIRHNGISTHWICHRYTDLPPTIRSQITRTCVFKCSMNDARVLADEHGKYVLEAPKLEQGQYMDITNFGEPVIRRVFIPRR